MTEPIRLTNSLQYFLACMCSVWVLLLTSCREYLPYRTTSPDISGVLLQRGMPLPDVVVYSCIRGGGPKRCAKYKKTTTDSQGNFYFDSVSDFIHQASDMGGSSFTYNINFQYQGRDYRWSAGGGEMPENTNLRCDVSQQQLCTVHHFSP